MPKKADSPAQAEETPLAAHAIIVEDSADSGPASGQPLDLVSLSSRAGLADWLLAHDPSQDQPPAGLPRLTEAEARWLRERVADPEVTDAVVAKRAKVQPRVARSGRVVLWLEAMQAELEGEIEALAGERVARLRALVLARLAREACYGQDPRVASLAAKVFLDHTPPEDAQDVDLKGLSTEALRARLLEIAGSLGLPVQLPREGNCAVPELPASAGVTGAGEGPPAGTGEGGAASRGP